MKKHKRYIIDIYRLVITIAFSFVAWKLVRHWRAGRAENTGNAIDSSIKAAAEKIEKSAHAVEEWADHNFGGSLGKGIDDVLLDTKKTLDNATNLVERALSFAQ